MTNHLTREDLWSLEEYDQRRNDFRTQVMTHKKDRRISLTDNIRLYFEDRMTIQYQIQEMLRIEKVFSQEGIQEELDAYNPLIPDGSNLKATFMLEFEDEAVRKAKVKELKGIENALRLLVSDYGEVAPICDEDLEREDAERTSTVHFMRFELTPDMIQAVKQGANLGFGIAHPALNVHIPAIHDNVRRSLLADLD